MLQEINFPSI